LVNHQRYSSLVFFNYYFLMLQLQCMCCVLSNVEQTSKYAKKNKKIKKNKRLG
jgi:hypothetical protein